MERAPRVGVSPAPGTTPHSRRRPKRPGEQSDRFVVATEVVDADLSGYFDTIDHAGLLRLVARRVSDGSALRLVKRFLKAPIVEEKKGKRSYHKNDRGTPQGGVLSPLLANL